MMIRAPCWTSLMMRWPCVVRPSQQDRYYGHIAIDRHLTLSAPEVARLLSVREGRGVQLVLNTWFSGQPASVPVDGGEPDFLMRLCAA